MKALSWAALSSLIMVVSCAERSSDPITEALSSPSGNFDQALSRCARVAFPELATTCRVEVAARAGSEGDPARAEQACAQIQDETWKQECHFRAGEELARAGMAIEALRHCVSAGRFGRFCLTHSGWGLPPEEGIDSSLEARELQDRVDLLLFKVEKSLRGATDGLDGEGRDIFRSRAWFNIYVGTGHARPTPARTAAEEQAPYARGAFAIEAVRLLFPSNAALPDDAVSSILAVYMGERPPPEGASLPPPRRVGRYHPPVPAPGELGAPRIPTYGGGMRLVGRDEREDLLIATLEALFFRESTPADAFLPWISDRSERVRWTAVRLFRLCPPDKIDIEAELLHLLEDPDETVRWNAKDALDHRTWEPPKALRAAGKGPG